MRLSARIARIQPSITLAISAKAQRLAQAGHDIISFGIGEPDFDTPAHIKEAAILAIQRGASKYTAVAGIPELRAAAAAELSRTHGVTLTPEQIVVSTGAKQCLFNILTALLDDGDEVIVPTPCWPSHVELVRMAGGVAVLCPQRAQDGFALDPEAVARLITPRTRAVLLNSPSNPTGAVYSKESLLGLAEVIRRANNPELLIITDDLYRRLCYAPTQFASFAQLAPDLAARTILVDGVSKAYAMTGWRIGFCAAPLPMATAMQTIQGQVTTNATAVAQHAALAALLGDQAPVAAMVAEFDARRQLGTSRGGAPLPGATFFLGLPRKKAALVGPTPWGSFFGTSWGGFSGVTGRGPPDMRRPVKVADAWTCFFLRSPGGGAVRNTSTVSHSDIRGSTRGRRIVFRPWGAVSHFSRGSELVSAARGAARILPCCRRTAPSSGDRYVFAAGACTA
jgi:aspartate aminotransferase